jgi:hypothetical protein
VAQLYASASLAVFTGRSRTLNPLMKRLGIRKPEEGNDLISFWSNTERWRLSADVKAVQSFRKLTWF